MKNNKVNNKNKKGIGFRESLENKARSFTKDLNGRIWDSSIPNVIKREIALTLNQIDNLVMLYEKLNKKLLKLETYVNTDILHLKPRPHNYINNKRKERSNLKKRLLKIEDERRRLSLDQEEKLQALHDRLLSLVNKLEQISPENGNRKASKKT